LKITQAGVGIASNQFTVRDSYGTGLIAVQAEVTGTATYRILGRVSPAAPWRELKGADASGFLESMALVPFLALEVLSGSGTVDLWVHEA
jgi:hypothetical protein